MRTSRRALLGASVLATASACTASPKRTTVGSPASSAAAFPTTASAPPASGAQPPSHTSTPAPTPSAPTVPTRETIVARFAGRSPAWFALQGEGIVSTTSAPGICLTLDACGGPGGSGVDEALLSHLLDQRIPFTAFLNSRWIEANPHDTQRLAQAAAAGNAEIGNHGTAHKPLSVTGAAAYEIPGTASVGEVYDEIMGCQQRLQQVVGVTARWFRPGTAHWDDVSVAIAAELGLRPAGFSINGDGGATFAQRTVTSEISRAGAGDVVIAHLNQPRAATGAGIMQALPSMITNGATFLTLSQAANA
ncbi:polysaccharide deacetylase family protein [Actinomyces trachealis]|uniref:polysaccharide deacetylase family protein n=1 Tax=Actinomyces trachealis TaxID=2763540 RepID=UPI001892A539|nr:polysaccharide deacetylase family protein [Actinomyces trachealis]